MEDFYKENAVPGFIIKRFSSMYRGKMPSVQCVQYWSYYLDVRKAGKVKEGMTWAIEAVVAPGKILILLPNLSYALLDTQYAFSAVANGWMMPVMHPPPTERRFAALGNLPRYRTVTPRKPAHPFLSTVSEAMRKFIMGHCEYEQWKVAGKDTFYCPMKLIGDAEQSEPDPSECPYSPEHPWEATTKMAVYASRALVRSDPNVFARNGIMVKELDLYLFPVSELVRLPFHDGKEHLAKALAIVCAYYEQYDLTSHAPHTPDAITRFLLSDPHRYLMMHLDLVIPSSYVMCMLFDRGESMLDGSLYYGIRALVHAMYGTKDPLQSNVISNDDAD